METKLKNYTAFIEKASLKPTKDLIKYHTQMLQNFQHERLIHLIITLFFVFISLCLIATSATLFLILPESALIYLFPLYAVTLILTILSGFYVRHYYVLENGVQNLYQYSQKLLT